MKRISIILIMGLCSVAVSSAQEPSSAQKPENTGTPPQLQIYDAVDSVMYHEWLNLAPVPTTIDLMQGYRSYKDYQSYRSSGSVNLKKAETLRLMQERAQQSIEMLPQTLGLHAPDKKAVTWTFTVGNTTWSNWSIFPDVYLDARTIKYPVPTGARPDNRPLEVRRLEKVGNR